ncbi:MAG: PP2C family protein-serine/threonine phosphatase [Acidimicrobiia bacterium]|nr:PP2C family protein-serine/threonine phosphatase [Acidimicrobiia bacterium]
MNVPPLPKTPGGPRGVFDAYTRGLTRADLERLFTRDTPEAYRFILRAMDLGDLTHLPWHLRLWTHVRLFFLAFTLKLSPARRAIFAAALAIALIGWIELGFADGTLSLLAAFALVNLLFLLEVADRLSLKNDLEVARQIQQSMLPTAAYHAAGVEAFGMTRPANTVGGDFYDILPLPDGRLLLALGDVAGKGSPAALLMALLLAMMRTLVDEGLGGADLVSRLNTQVAKHAPGSRFITLFVATLDPATGRLTYVNAGQNPPLLRRTSGTYERLREGGIALGMFDHATYQAGQTHLATGDVLVMYSDGVTEAEDAAGQPFDERGLEGVVDANCRGSAKELGWATFAAVERHAMDKRLADDLTVLIARKLPPLPGAAVAETAAVGV